MPHITLEHSEELLASHDLKALSDDLFDAACAHEAFSGNPKAVKVRTLACSNLRSGVTPETFGHLSVRMLPGRTTETKVDLANTLLAVLDRHLPDVGSLSVEPIDMDAETYTKRAL